MRTTVTAMSARFTRPKRLARIAMSSWSAETKRALADAERRAGTDVGVPIGDGTCLLYTSDAADDLTDCGVVVVVDYEQGRQRGRLGFQNAEVFG